jgi:hypothetical protein
VLYTHTQTNRSSDKLMSTNIREKRNQPVREKKRAKIINFVVKFIPYPLVYHLEEKNNKNLIEKVFFLITYQLH